MPMKFSFVVIVEAQRVLRPVEGIPLGRFLQAGCPSGSCTESNTNDEDCKKNQHIKHHTPFFSATF